MDNGIVVSIIVGICCMESLVIASGFIIKNFIENNSNVKSKNVKS